MSTEASVSTSPRVLFLGDRHVQLSLSGVLLLAILLATPAWRTDPAVVRSATTLFLILAITSIAHRLHEIRNGVEKAFWALTAAANVFWIVSAAIRIFYGDTAAVYAVTDLGFSLYYICVILVVERQPHAPRRRSRWVTIHLPAIAVFVFGLFAYFILIPARFNEEAYNASPISAYLYATIDLFLTLRLAYLARSSRSVRWRVLYLALAFWPALMLAGDIVGNLSSSMAWANYFYALAILVLSAVARLRHLLPDDAEEVDTEGAIPEPGGQTLVYALVFPVVHLAIYRFGFDVLDLPSQAARETLVFFWILILGSVAVLQHAFLERQTRQLAEGNLQLNQELAWRERLEVASEQFIAELEAKNVEIRSKNNELERFTHVVSHDLKSPLFTIQGFLGLLERDIESGDVERLRADLEHVSQAVHRMRGLLDDLLEISRAGRQFKPRPVSLDKVAAEAVSLVEGRLLERGVTVEVTKDLGIVDGEPTLLLQLFQNLLDNAVKFMDDTGERRVEVGRRDGEGEAVYFVRDNGIGIAEEDQERVFDLFQRLDSHTEGTGVGLALVRRVVESHHGRVWLESDGEGRGTTVFFTLPGGEDVTTDTVHAVLPPR